MDIDPTPIVTAMEVTAMEARHADVQMLAIMIPIVAIVMGISLAMIGLWLDFRRKRQVYELHHLERMAAIEKGIELPALPVEFYSAYRRRGPTTPLDLLRKALVLLFVGIALVVTLSYEQQRLSLWGLLPVGVGLAYLIVYLAGRGARPAAGREDAGPGAGS